ncbi:YodC family protein [Trinickia mobilis]|uniref:YodC family protein n=1 Tax=Trinickia mobilis TaxID=2816356 RepID=UPI001A8F0D3A|nr:YodC family protein [Trinickia mobilis]
MLNRSRTRYRVGDVLTLKSGSMPMTATYVGPVVFAPGTWLICQWADQRGDLQQGMFPEATLERAQHARRLKTKPGNGRLTTAAAPCACNTRRALRAAAAAQLPWRKPSARFSLPRDIPARCAPKPPPR